MWQQPVAFGELLHDWRKPVGLALLCKACRGSGDQHHDKPKSRPLARPALR